jgi:hypothetical protein
LGLSWPVFEGDEMVDLITYECPREQMLASLLSRVPALHCGPASLEEYFLSFRSGSPFGLDHLQDGTVEGNHFLQKDFALERKKTSETPNLANGDTRK